MAKQEVGAPIPSKKSRGDMIMEATPTESGPKKPKNELADAVKSAEESLNDSMPITSTALAVWKVSPSAPAVTNWLLFSLVMLIERGQTEQPGEKSSGSPDSDER